MKIFFKLSPFLVGGMWFFLALTGHSYTKILIYGSAIIALGFAIVAIPVHFFPDVFVGECKNQDEVMKRYDKFSDITWTITIISELILLPLIC